MFFYLVGAFSVGSVMNRIRGGGFLPEFGTAKKMWLMAAVMAAFVYPVGGWVNAALIAAALVIWDLILPWHRYFSFNVGPRLRGPQWTEKLIEAITERDGVRRDWACFLVRNVVAFSSALAPFAIWGDGIAPAIAFAILGVVMQQEAYRFGAMYFPAFCTVVGEFVTGAFVWGAIVAAFYIV